jgi:RsiW-degrading membrane proteinase PrsW (M82 family)
VERERQHFPDPDLMVAVRAVLRLLPSAPATLVAKVGSSQRSTYVAPVTGDVTSVGRGLQNAVVLLDPTVSREHAILEQKGTSWTIHNVSSAQPLAVEDLEVSPGTEAALLPGDTLRIGVSRLAFLAPEAEVESAADQPLLDLPSDDTRILGPGITLQFALRGRRDPRFRWLVGLAAAVVLAVSGLATLGSAALAGQDALRSGGITAVVVAATIPLIPALGVTLLIGIFDRYEREPLVTLLGAFVWGAIIAIPPSLLFEHRLNAILAARLSGGSGAAAMLANAGGQAAVAGVTEELIKGAGLLLLLIGLRDEFDNVTDGVLYGLLIGAGFAVVENFVYLALSPSNELPYLVLVRVGLGWLSHSAFTALFGAGLGYARERGRVGRLRLLVPCLGLLAAILLHTWFDFVVYATSWLGGQPATAPSSPLLLMVVLLVAGYGPVFVTQVLLLKVLIDALGREAETIRCYLADEVLGGVVLPDEYLIVQDAGLRGGAERRILRRFGPRAYLTSRAFYQTLTGLAFRKWHVAQGDLEKKAPQQPEEAYRERLARLRRSLARQLT